MNKKAIKPKPIALPLADPPPALPPARVLKPMNTAFDREMEEQRAKKAADAAAKVAPQAPATAKLAAVPGLKPEPPKPAVAAVPVTSVPAAKPEPKPAPKALAKAPEEKPDPKPPTPPAAVAPIPQAAPKAKPQKREIYRIRIEDVRELFGAFAEELGLNATEIAQLHERESGLDRKCFERLVAAVNAAADAAALNGSGVAIG